MKKLTKKSARSPGKSSSRKSAAVREPDPKKILPGLVRAARASGAILRKYYERHSKSGLKISEKMGAGLVTNADIESEKSCVRLLRALRPDFAFLTEEGTVKLAHQNENARGRWIIDPLDGTTNFVHGFPMFCVSLAAEWDGQVIAAVIEHPILRETYTATLGGGAFVNGRRMRVSTTYSLENSLLSTGFTYRKNELLHTEMEAFEELSRVARAIRRPGSAALDLAYTARGIFDGFWERRLSPWDIAAGLLLVREAGGKVTDFSDNPDVIHSPAVLASNGVLHGSLLRAITPRADPRLS
jgi:myo-inositol-1(or 4)-monophosphatase